MLYTWNWDSIVNLCYFKKSLYIYIDFQKEKESEMKWKNQNITILQTLVR